MFGNGEAQQRHRYSASLSDSDIAVGDSVAKTTALIRSRTVDVTSSCAPEPLAFDLVVLGPAVLVLFVVPAVVPRFVVVPPLVVDAVDVADDVEDVVVILVGAIAVLGLNHPVCLLSRSSSACFRRLSQVFASHA